MITLFALWDQLFLKQVLQARGEKKSSVYYFHNIIYTLSLDKNIKKFYINIKMFVIRNFSLRIAANFRMFCTQFSPSPTQAERILEYSSWAIARSEQHNHNVSHLRRELSKDRYNIHKLTDLEFMLKIIKRPDLYHLTLNENIMLYSQIVHVFEVLGKTPTPIQTLFMKDLMGRIFMSMSDPPDLICIGSLMNIFIITGKLEQSYWSGCVEEILLFKFDENYDELFGMIVSLMKYRQHVEQKHENFFEITYNAVLPKIPIIYRNSLQVVRQFVTQNVYNLKQCKLLFQAFYEANINQSYFWDSVRDWFNIYIKQQLNKKVTEQFFIMKQNAVQKILFDQGIIRPRPILQQLASIAFYLSEYGNNSWRFIQFTQDLVLYAFSQGSQLFKKFQEICQREQKQFSSNIQQNRVNINEHIRTSNQQQKQNIKEMEKKYKTIFVNPISLRDQYIVYLLVAFSRAYKKFDETENNKEKYKDKKQSIYDSKNQIVLDSKIKNWLLRMLVKQQMQYSVKELLLIYRCKRFLSDSKVDVAQLMVEKLTNLRFTNCTFNELKQIMDIIYPVNYNKLVEVLADFLFRVHPSQIYKFTKYLENNELFIYMSDYLIRLPAAVNMHEKYFSFEQNCYFFYMLLKNEKCLNLDYCSPYARMRYEGQMQKIKESLKIATYSRGFKITMDSYFHKIMDYIDVVDFFESNRP